MFKKISFVTFLFCAVGLLNACSSKDKDKKPPKTEPPKKEETASQEQGVTAPPEGPVSAQNHPPGVLVLNNLDLEGEPTNKQPTSSAPQPSTQ